MTHAELVARAGRWLRTVGCSIVFEELNALTSEVPDAIGWRDAGRLSYLVECKATRGDFLADKNKSFRQRADHGMGHYRYFMCPPGLIKVSELPPRWGLLYVHARSVSVEAGRHPRNWNASAMATYWHKANRDAEIRLLVSALNRLRLDLGDALWTERVHRGYTERQEMAESVRGRRHLFIE